MIEAKEGFFDRVEQSFDIFKGNFKSIFLPLFIWGIIFVILIETIINLIFLNYLESLKDISILNIEVFWKFFEESILNHNFIWLFIWIIFFVLFNVILVLPFVIATIKSTSDYYLSNKKSNSISNILYGFKNLFNLFKIYFFKFIYIYSIPIILFFVWITLFSIFNISEVLMNFILNDIDKLDLSLLKEYNIPLQYFYILIFFVFILVILLIFCISMLPIIIYKKIKSSFIIFWAIDKNDYSKNNFNKSINITKWQWWRILWNLLLIGIIIYFISYFILDFSSKFKEPLIDKVYIWTFSELSENIVIEENWQENIAPVINKLIKSINGYSYINLFIWILEMIIKTILAIFLLIFVYLFYKRLELESEIELWFKESTTEL